MDILQVVFNEDLKHKLDRQFQRLSSLEKKVIYAIATDTEAISMSKLLESTQLLLTDLVNAIQSLSRRFLIEQQQDNNQTLFTLQPLIRHYITLQMELVNNLSSDNFEE